MSRNRVSLWFTAVSAAVTMLIMGAGIAVAAHPAVDIQLFTFEEIADQYYGDGNPFNAFDPAVKMPVVIQDTGNMKGMPYSPKQTCGGCHDYENIQSHAFHSTQGFFEFQDTADGELNANQAKPWTQSGGMFGKW